MTPVVVVQLIQKGGTPWQHYVPNMHDKASVLAVEHVTEGEQEIWESNIEDFKSLCNMHGWKVSITVQEPYDINSTT